MAEASRSVPTHLPRLPDRGFRALTPRELKVLRMLARGQSPVEIAEDLYISLHTVRTNLKSIYSKLGVHDRIAAVIAAYDHALVSPKYSDGVLKALEVEAMLTDNDPAGYADRALSAYQAHRGERR